MNNSTINNTPIRSCSANSLKYSTLTWGGRNYLLSFCKSPFSPSHRARTFRGGFFVSALMAVMLVMLLCSCTKEGAEAVLGNKIQFPDSTSTGLHIVWADTICPVFTIDTSWLGDTVIHFDPLEP